MEQQMDASEPTARTTPEDTLASIAERYRGESEQHRSLVESNRGLVARGRQAAQGLVEYGLVIGVVGVLAIAALTRLGTNIGALLDRLGELIKPVAGG